MKFYAIDQNENAIPFIVGEADQAAIEALILQLLDAGYQLCIGEIVTTPCAGDHEATDPVILDFMIRAERANAYQIEIIKMQEESVWSRDNAARFLREAATAGLSEIKS